LKKGPNREIRGCSLSHLLLFNLFLLSTLVLSTRLATFLHEVLGHGLTAAALGAEVNGIRLSLFGGGNAYYQFEGGPARAGAFAVSFGGILVNLITGLVSILLSGRAETGRGRAVYLSLFGMVSLLGGLVYTCLGFYYGVGDPEAWMSESSATAEWLWAPCLALLPVASFFGVKAFFRSIQPWFSAVRFTEKVLVLLLTLGITGSIYAGLYRITGQRSVALESSAIAQSRAAEKARREVLAVYERLREDHPEWTEEDLSRVLSAYLVSAERQWRPPLIPVLAVLQLVGALFALRRGDRTAAVSPRLPPALALSSAVLAAAVIGLLVLTSGWVWKAV